MQVPIRSWSVSACAVAMLIVASSAAAQVEDQLNGYTKANAEGYLQPLADALGADLNGGIWHTAHIPESGFYISLETHLVAVFFSDEHRTFTYDGTSVEVPTVVGEPEGGVILPDIAYAPGFDINSFALAAPQIRIGAFKGTEALFRYIALDVGDTEFGSIDFIGVGGRHSISQWMGPTFPVDVAAGFFWQKFTLGDDLIDAQATTFGVQVGKRFSFGFAAIEPYACISYDTFKMDVTYEFEDGILENETINLEMESDGAVRMTLGLHAQAAFLDVNGEYSFGNLNGFALGVGINFGS